MKFFRKKTTKIAENQVKLHDAIKANDVKLTEHYLEKLSSLDPDNLGVLLAQPRGSTIETGLLETAFTLSDRDNIDPKISKLVEAAANSRLEQVQAEFQKESNKLEQKADKMSAAFNLDNGDGLSADDLALLEELGIDSSSLGDTDPELSSEEQEIDILEEFGLDASSSKQQSIDGALTPEEELELQAELDLLELEDELSKLPDQQEKFDKNMTHAEQILQASEQGSQQFPGEEYDDFEEWLAEEEKKEQPESSKWQNMVRDQANNQEKGQGWEK